MFKNFPNISLVFSQNIRILISSNYSQNLEKPRPQNFSKFWENFTTNFLKIFWTLPFKISTYFPNFSHTISEIYLKFILKLSQPSICFIIFCIIFIHILPQIISKIQEKFFLEIFLKSHLKIFLTFLKFLQVL